MARLLTILLGVLVVLPARGAINAVYNFQDILGAAHGTVQVTVSPLINHAINDTNIVTRDFRNVRTTLGSYTFTNLYVPSTGTNGISYRVEFKHQIATTTITSTFPAGLTGTVVGSSSEYTSAPIAVDGTTAYSQAVANSIFLNASGDTSTGGQTNNSAAGWRGNGEGLTNLNAVATLAGRATNLSVMTITNLGDLIITTNNNLSFRRSDNVQEAAIFFNKDHPPGGEWQFSGYEQFSLSMGQNLQKRSYNHFGTSADSQEIYVFQHEGAATSTRTNSPSKQFGFAANYWNGSASTLLRVGPRLIPGDTSGTNWAIKYREFTDGTKVDAYGGTGNEPPHTNYVEISRRGVGLYLVDNWVPNFYPAANPTTGLALGTNSLKYINSAGVVHLDSASNSFAFYPAATATVGTTALELPPIAGFGNVHTYRILGANTPSFQWSIPTTFAGGRTNFVTHISVLRTNAATSNWECSVYLNAADGQHVVVSGKNITFAAGTNIAHLIFTNTFPPNTFSASNILGGAVKIVRTPGETDTSYFYGGYIRTQ